MYISHSTFCYDNECINRDRYLLITYFKYVIYNLIYRWIAYNIRTKSSENYFKDCPSSNKIPREFCDFSLKQTPYLASKMCEVIAQI